MARRFVDARGTEWEVWEVGARTPLADSPAIGARRGKNGQPAESRWLRFVSATQRRRLAPFPARWEALDANGLADLCQAARPEAPDMPRLPMVGLGDAMWLGEG